MISHYEISREAGALRKNKQFAEALELFKQLFEEYKDECNEFDWWGYAQCLLKLDHYHESLKVSEEGSHKYPDSEYIRNIYHWSLYHVVIKPELVNDRQEFFNAVDEITLNSDPANKYSPFVRTIFTAIDVLELNYNENASRATTSALSYSPFSQRISAISFFRNQSFFRKSIHWYSARLSSTSPFLYSERAFMRLIHTSLP
jgi:tetratricopeptide (TPR) repeat protein